MKPDKKVGYKIGSGGPGPGPKPLKREPSDLYTGTYNYGADDPDSIETVGMYQKKSMKMFKQAKDADSLWLKKKNAVRQQIDEPYSRFKGQEVQ